MSPLASSVAVVFQRRTGTLGIGRTFNNGLSCLGTRVFEHDMVDLCDGRFKPSSCYDRHCLAPVRACASKMLVDSHCVHHLLFGRKNLNEKERSMHYNFLLNLVKRQKLYNNISKSRFSTKKGVACLNLVSRPP